SSSRPTSLFGRPTLRACSRPIRQPGVRTKPLPPGYFIYSCKRSGMPLEKRPCSKCQQHVASVKFTTIRNGMVEERHLCQQCAATQSPYQKKSMPQLDEILSGI